MASLAGDNQNGVNLKKISSKFPVEENPLDGKGKPY
jgi:hypothetical protein